MFAGWEAVPSGARDPGPFYHGTKAELKVGDLIGPGYASNYGNRKQARVRQHRTSSKRKHPNGVREGSPG